MYQKRFVMPNAIGRFPPSLGYPLLYYPGYVTCLKTAQFYYSMSYQSMFRFFFIVRARWNTVVYSL